MEDIEVVYSQLRDNFIMDRTRQEAILKNIADNIAKMPEELKARIEMPDHPITLKDFIPVLYDEDSNDRKAYAEQFYRCNKFIDSYNALVDENDAEAVKILAELREKRALKL